MFCSVKYSDIAGYNSIVLYASERELIRTKTACDILYATTRARVAEHPPTLYTLLRTELLKY